jgi:hypothetical protein
MLTLVAMATADAIFPDAASGKIWVIHDEIESKRELPGELLDDFVARGWVALPDDDGLAVTEKGCYWARRWMERTQKSYRRELRLEARR